MTHLAEQLESLGRHLAGALAEGAGHIASEGEHVTTLLALGRIQRQLDGAITQVTDAVIQQDEGAERSERVTSRAGCRNVTELLRRTPRVDGHTARQYVTAASGIRREMNLSSGELLAAPFPALTEALLDGELSVTGYLSCTVPLQKSRQIGLTDRLAADALLGRFAHGIPLDDTYDVDVDSGGIGPAPTTDELAGLTAHIIARLDPDGAEPKDEAGKRRRYFTIGRFRDGSVPVRGELMPEVAAQLQRIIDSLLNPKVDNDSTSSGPVRFRPSEDGDGATADDAAPDDASFSAVRDDGLSAHRAAAPCDDGADLRTHAQKRHDALATALMVAAASGGMPLIGGAAPTLVVAVRADDFQNRKGRARLEGVGYDVPLGVADHAACAGLIQRVLFDDDGAIVALGTSARTFNAHQRRAIIARDKQCLIPGCGIAAEWCEIHHVIEAARGGPTHTSNGVPLCWHHHRTLDTGAWQIRMRNGTPEIRGPNWWDPYGLWRSPHLGYVATDQAIDDALDDAREHERAGASR